MKIVISPDSFKHSMNAPQACGIIAAAIRAELPGTVITELPVADGGEGTADTMLAAAGGRKVYHTVTGPEFRELESYYVVLNADTAEKTVIIELASISGLMLAEEPNPEKTTTYGVGEMIKKALDDVYDGGRIKIILCIGGSATNDAGIGALSALGARFLNSRGDAVVPCGESLSVITSADFSGLDARLRGCEIQIACDVENPLYGERGAAYIFAPQKGADAAMVARLDAGLRNIAGIMRESTGTDVAAIPGGGAAGGIAAGFVAASGAELRPGIELVLDAVGFDAAIAGADLIITGEGKTDPQTLGGKTVLGVARRAARQGVPVIVISGALDGEIDRALYDEGVLAVFSSCRVTEPFERIRHKCPDWLGLTARNVIRTFRSAQK